MEGNAQFSIYKIDLNETQKYIANFHYIDKNVSFEDVWRKQTLKSLELSEK